MIRKFKIQLQPSNAARALAQLIFSCGEHWPASWLSLQAAAELAERELRRETDALVTSLEQIDASPGVATLFADDRDEATTELGLVTVSLDVDLPLMLGDDRAGVDAARTLLALLRTLSRSAVYAFSVRLGAREADLHDALEELNRQAMSKGVVLEVNYGPREGDGVDPTDVFGDGSIVGDEIDDRELRDEERAFLEEAGLGWPARERALDEAWKSVAFAAHPDRRPDDDGAALRFSRLRDGYLRLKRRAAL